MKKSPRHLVYLSIASLFLVATASSSQFWHGLFGLRRRPFPARGEQNVTRIQEYVASVEERDARDRREQYNSENVPQEKEHDTAGDDWNDPNSLPSSTDGGHTKESSHSSVDEEPVAVGVKSHKKSGSVGDADSDDDDDSTDSDESEWEWEEFKGEMLVTPTQLEVEVEFVEDDEHSNEPPEDNLSAVTAGGGVGVIMNQRPSRRYNQPRSVATATFEQSPVKEQEMMEAWLPHVYLPPGKNAMDYLSSGARMIDGASKSRLDRRTLYACLLMEWLHANATYRKFLEKATSQALQAALSLATQPQWRKCSSQRLCGIRLYDNEAERGCTLAMQETVVMALVRVIPFL
jgi:hypothetical protein